MTERFNFTQDEDSTKKVDNLLQNDSLKIDHNSMELFSKIRKEWQNLSFSDENLIEIFNNKYSNTDTIIPLLDESGNPVVDINDKRVIIDFKQIDDFDKKRHIRGLVHSFDGNLVDYVLKLSKEKELLEVANKNGSNIKKLVDECVKIF
jgi:hypothetical protein